MGVVCRLEVNTVYRPQISVVMAEVFEVEVISLRISLSFSFVFRLNRPLNCELCSLKELPQWRIRWRILF
jgi:hypothetical protein